MLPTPSPTLQDSCLARVQALNDDERWNLSPVDCLALAQAVLPWALAANPRDFADLGNVIHNYYLDGVMVEELRTADLSTVGSETIGELWTFTLSVARVRLNLDDQAEDVAQESWIDALHAIRDYRFHFRSRFKTFLYSLVLYRGRNMLRHAHAQRRGGTNIPESLDTLTEHNAPPAEVGDYPGRCDWINGELFQIVDTAITQYCDKLNQGQIQAEVKARLSRLVFLEGEALPDAAAQLGLNYDTAVTIIRRVRLYLKQRPELRE